MAEFPIQSIIRKIYRKFGKNSPEKLLGRNYLTKQKFQSFLRCEMAAWLNYHQNKSKESSAKKYHTSSIEYQKIRDVLKELYPGGAEVRYAKSVEDSIRSTLKYIKKRIPVYSASLGRGDFFSVFDLLVPSKISDSWDIVSVKSQASYKKDNVLELAYQKLVAEKSGLNIDEIVLYTINADYFYRKKLDARKLFFKNSLTRKVNLEAHNVLKYCDKYFQVIGSHAPPENPYICKFPSDCLNRELCYPDLKDGNIFDLREGKDLSRNLYKAGIVYLKDVPEETELTHKQAVQVECERTGKAHVVPEQIKSFLQHITYPLYFLDFETINPAVPFFQNTKPFQHIPTQYSLHVKLTKESELKHYSFLAKNKSDPRKKILKNLRKLISPSGKVIVYDAFFERRCLTESVELFPKFKEWWDIVSKNILDISIPFKSFHYYHPVQKGRASLKAVLPALTGLNYDGLEIHDGGTANQEFYKYLTTRMSHSEKKKLCQNMEEYCKMDTYALVEILNELEKLPLESDVQRTGI